MERRQVQQFNGEKAGHPVPTSLLLLAYAQGRSREGALRPTLLFLSPAGQGTPKNGPQSPGYSPETKQRAVLPGELLPVMCSGCFPAPLPDGKRGKRGFLFLLPRETSSWVFYPQQWELQKFNVI